MTRKTPTKKQLDDMETPTGYVKDGRQIKASAELPDSIPTKRRCPECDRVQFKLGDFYVCNAHHVYNERGKKVG